MKVDDQPLGAVNPSLDVTICHGRWLCLCVQQATVKSVQEENHTTNRHLSEIT